MKFIDVVSLTVHAGKGGNGCVSFRREKYVPKGGPDGGTGGDGGNVIIKGDPGIQTLLDLRYKHEYRAGDGVHGKGSNMTGRNGKDLVVRVPFGTLVYDEQDGAELADITEEFPEFTVASGGRGGRGNSSFVSPTHRAPRISEPGEPGESKTLRLELKLIADVGIIGYPNAGKSTFISVVSAARPKIADYPFTTLAPVLGVVKNDYGGSYVIADMPGLIEGASRGAGLGLRFLRHIERTSLLLHFVDSSQETSMIERYESIRKELESYSPQVAQKHEIVVASKADSANEQNLNDFKRYMQKEGKELYIISSFSKEGIQELMKCLNHIYQIK